MKAGRPPLNSSGATTKLTDPPGGTGPRPDSAASIRMQSRITEFDPPPKIVDHLEQHRVMWTFEL